MSKIVTSSSEQSADSLSLVERVYNHLLEKIISGSIRYGEAISIKKVAGELSVSSMPVREAVKRLEFEGVVTIKPRSACRVRIPSRRMILEVYEVREALEGYAVMHGRGRLDPAAVGRLRVIVEKMRLLSSETSVDAREHRAIELDRQFHSEIIALAGNELLDSFSRQLSLHVNMTLMHEKTYHALEAEWAAMHAEIVDCLESDPARAVDLLRQQFARATELWKANGKSSQNL
ncbi:MAG: GntR family transcriptional regulator [Spirochaetia bacterium]|jgi:DNA-binding GntR family transcriptional regulator